MSNDRETLANIVKDLMSILKTKDLVRKEMSTLKSKNP